MNTLFTQTAPASSSRTRLQGAILVKAFFAAVVASLGFAGTANAQLGGVITCATTAPTTTTTTVAQYITANGATNFCNPTAIQFVENATNTMAYVKNDLPSNSYAGASGANNLSFVNNRSLIVKNIQVDNLQQVTVSFGIYAPTQAALDAFAVKYGKATGNSASAGNANNLVNVATINNVGIVPGTWNKVDLVMPFAAANQQGNFALSFVNGTAADIRIDDINVNQFNTSCTITPGQFTWTNSGGDYNFNNGNNWCPNAVPGATDLAVIKTNTSTPIQITSNTSVYRLIFENTSTSATVLPLAIGSGLSLTVGTGGLDLSAVNSGAVARVTTNINSNLIVNGPATFANTGLGAVSFTSNSTTASPAFIKFAGNVTNKSAGLTFAGNRVEFTGTTNQDILGNQDITFQNLKFNNTGATGSDIVSFANSTFDLTVNGALEFTAGQLHTGDKKVIYGTSATISETNASYLKGNLDVLARNVNTTTGENFGGLGVKLTMGSAIHSTGIKRVTGQGIEVQVPIVIGQPAMTTNKSITRLFEINVAGAPTGLDAKMEFEFWDHELNGLSAGTLVFFRQNDQGLWSNKGVTAIDAPSLANGFKGTASLEGIDAFSPWTLGSSVTPLPVELISFSAKRDADAAVLSWATASEENNAGYEIEASTDNRNFTSIGYVNAMQTAYQGAEYSFIEPKAASHGVRYYRLTQFDLDGTKTILGVRTVSFNSTGVSVITGPNPFTYGFAALVEADKAQPATLTLVDALGREVARQQEQLVRGVNQVDFNGADLSNGSYILSVQLETEVLTVKVNKQ